MTCAKPELSDNHNYIAGQLVYAILTSVINHMSENVTSGISPEQLFNNNTISSAGRGKIRYVGGM